MNGWNDRSSPYKGEDRSGRGLRRAEIGPIALPSPIPNPPF